jgi:heptosyltransferase III
MKHDYKTEVFWKECLQSVIDFFVDIYVNLFIKIDKSTKLAQPNKILFIILAQLGDTLVMSYLFPFIRERFPNSQIDVLIGEWSKPILENNPYINNVFYFNHVRMNRSKDSLWRKITIHFKSSRSALKYIQLQRYDLSIEGGVTHPNGNIITYRGKVKTRIGFGSGGFGSLLTDEVSLPKHTNFHILEAILEELRIIGINKTLNDIRPYFQSSKPNNTSDLSINKSLKTKNPFVIIHPESGNLNHKMSNKFWLQIVRRIMAINNIMIIFCGTSKETSNLLNYLLSNIKGSENRIIDTVQKLSLDEFFKLSNNSLMAFTVDSLAAHFCSINSKTISLYNNGYGRYFFPIPNINTIIIHNHLTSKDHFLHPKIKEIYVSNFDSESTFRLIEKQFEQILFKV